MAKLVVEAKSADEMREVLASKNPHDKNELDPVDFALNIGFK
jgi:hypothetical protein